MTSTSLFGGNLGPGNTIDVIDQEIANQIILVPLERTVTLNQFTREVIMTHTVRTVTLTSTGA